jgi:hypothetical protein
MIDLVLHVYACKYVKQKHIFLLQLDVIFRSAMCLSQYGFELIEIEGIIWVMNNLVIDKSQ